MAGTGLDALMIRDADRGLKDKLGRAAYVWSGAATTGATERPPPSTSTVTSGSRVTPVAFWSATSATSPVGSLRSITPAPPMGVSMSR